MDLAHLGGILKKQLGYLSKKKTDFVSFWLI